METRQVILQLRTAKGLSQEELAAKVYVTRQAVSRWETGETVPNTETLKLLSQLFDVSINTLLGSPRTLVCQCCGMPLDDSTLSKGPDGAFNEDYCKWCYADGQFAYPTKASLLDYLMAHMPNPDNAAAAGGTHAQDHHAEGIQLALEPGQSAGGGKNRRADDLQYKKYRFRHENRPFPT